MGCSMVMTALLVAVSLPGPRAAGTATEASVAHTSRMPTLVESVLRARPAIGTYGAALVEDTKKASTDGYVGNPRNVAPAFSPVVVAWPVLADAMTLYAYARGRAESPTRCPQTSATSRQCTMAEALSLAPPGGTIMLASAGNTWHYTGNWTINVLGTSPELPVTIRPAPHVANPALDGNDGKPTGCQTKVCDGPVLSVGPGVHLNLYGIAIRNASNVSTNGGGAIANNAGGTVFVSACTFLANSADDGGAIANDKFDGNGTVVVVNSTFVGNLAVADGGAIDNADLGGKGTLRVSASTFFSNAAVGGDGGAIDNADYSGSGTVLVSAARFSSNTAGGLVGPGDGGAIANAGSSATSRGTVVVSGSTFMGNVASNDGGAIANAGAGKGTLSVSASTFWGNTAIPAALGGRGAAIANGYYPGGDGILTVSASTFSGDPATNGGVIDNGDNDSTATVWTAADIFNGPCYNVAGTWDDAGYNIASDATCLRAGTGDMNQATDPLGALASNGGPTKTMLPLEGNSAVGSIPYGTTAKLNGRTITLCPTIDQRGERTASGKRCNAGAVQ